MNAPAQVVPPYKHTPLFPLGEDATPYRKLTAEGVRVERIKGREFSWSSARRCARWRRRHSPTSIICCGRATSSSCARSSTTRGVRQRQVRRLRLPQERQYRGRRRAADVPGHRHRDHHGQEGPVGLHRRRRRSGARGGRARRLPQAQPALLAARADLHVRGDEHQVEHAGAGRDLRRRRGRKRSRLQVPVHRQGRRLGQQIVPVPGDAFDPHPGAHDRLSQGEGPHARHRRVPALSPRHRHRRHLGRAHHEDREARVLPLSRQPAHARLRGRPCLPRPRNGAGGAQAHPVARRRRAVRRQVFLPRRARDPAAAPRRLAADRARRVVRRRPPGARQDQP